MRRKTKMESTGTSLRVIIGDPGRSNDPFGIIGLEATWPERKIYTRLAKQFIKTDYDTVAKYFANLSKKIKPHIMLLEKNFDYDNVYPAFSKYKLPIKYVTTSTSLTEKTRAKGWAVDKNYMMGWLQQEYKKHTVQFPENPNDDMAELINQRNQIVGITAPSGHVSYKAQRGRHDDLFMAKLIGCNAIRIWWNMQ